MQRNTTKRATLCTMAAVSVVAISASALAQSIAVGKKIEITVNPATLSAEEDALWQKFGGWCAIKDWHPAIVDCVESEEGGTTFRTLTLKDGGTIKEKRLEQQKRLYRYEIIESPLPVKNYQAQFSLTPDDDDTDELHLAWSAVFDAKDKSDKDARDVISGIFDAGLASIKSQTGAADDD